MEYPRRRQLHSTARGREALQVSPELIKVKFLQRNHKHIEFIQGKKEDWPSFAFAHDAREYVSMIESKIILIDEKWLAGIDD